MTGYKLGDILILEFPHSEGHKVSKRPVLVLADIDEEDIIVAKVTSSKERTPFDIPVNDWESAGLLLPSVIRMDKLATLSKSRIIRKLGALNTSYHPKIKVLLKKLFALN